MEIATTRQRVVLEASLERSVIRGALTGPSGKRRDFHGWLELNTALEAILNTGADGARTNCPQTLSSDRLRGTGMTDG